MTNRKILVRLFVLTGGAGIVLLAIFAFQLGLDNDPGWGPRRLQMLGTGISVILVGSLYWITPALSRWFKEFVQPILETASIFQGMRLSIQKIKTRLEKLFSDSIWVGKIKQNPWFSWVSRNATSIWLVMMGCLVLWLYLWVITIGRIDTWSSGRDYYWMLTQAFQKGQTYLLVAPP